MIALVLTCAIAGPYFCFIHNPSTVTLELALIALNNILETGVMKNAVILLDFWYCITKEIPTITIIDFMPNILSVLLLHINELRRMTHGKYFEYSVCILGAVFEFAGT